MKYPMKLKTEKPCFEYLVRLNSCLDYYLFEEFDDALKTAMALSSKNGIALVYEIFFNTTTREFFGRNTFKAYDGYVDYDKHGRADLHIEFYVNAGEWLNPKKEWMEDIECQQEIEQIK